jgi:hypothetical protein
MKINGLRNLYPATWTSVLTSRFFALPYIVQAALILIAAVYIIVITIVSVGGGGYESVTVTDPDFNKTVRIFYDVFVPDRVSSLTPELWKCNPSNIKVNDGTCPVEH